MLLNQTCQAITFYPYLLCPVYLFFICHIFNLMLLSLLYYGYKLLYLFIFILFVSSEMYLYLNEQIILKYFEDDTCMKIKIFMTIKLFSTALPKTTINIFVIFLINVHFPLYEFIFLEQSCWAWRRFNKGILNFFFQSLVVLYLNIF